MALGADLDTPTAGSLSAFGKTAHQARRAQESAISVQRAALSPWRTVAATVERPLEIQGVDTRARRARVAELLELVGLGDFAKSYPDQLSGGMQQRVAIARAIAYDPEVLIMDEPFAGVDPIAVHDIQQIVAALRHRGIGLIITDHNVEQTLDIVDRAYIMYDGRVRVSGSVAELVWNDEVAEIFLAGEEVPTEKLVSALRKGTIQNCIQPVLCGSALRDRGVLPLLDAVVDLLPSPLDVPPVHGTKPGTDEIEERPPDPKAPLAALAFKVAMDEGRRHVYIRVYSGTLEAGAEDGRIVGHWGLRDLGSKRYRAAAVTGIPRLTYRRGDLRAGRAAPVL